MSGKVQPASVPALTTSERASKLLDEIVYERVLGCVDLELLFGFEQELGYALGECGVPQGELGHEARALIDRALARIAADPHRYAPFGSCDGNPFGFDCADCAEEARDAAKRRG